MAENLHRQSEQTDADPLGTDAVRTVARKLATVVADPTVHPSIFVRVARAVVQRRVSPEEVARLCDTIMAKHRAGEFEKSAGAYFITSVMRMFKRNQVPWRSPRPEPRTDLFAED